MTMTSRGDTARQQIANSFRDRAVPTLQRVDQQTMQQYLLEIQRMKQEISDITAIPLDCRRYLNLPLPAPKVHEPFRDIGAERAAARQAEAKNIAARFDGAAVSTAMQRADHTTRDNWRPGYANLYL